MNNPWNLTNKQAEVLCAVIETGCQKLAAKKLNVKVSSIKESVRSSKLKMKPMIGICYLIAWDRWWFHNVNCEGANDE
jgi:hypothetical protein